MKFKFLILIPILLFISCVNGQNRINNRYSIPLYKESINDSSLNNFINILYIAINKKDTNVLFSLIDSEIVTSYGGAIYGKKEFIKFWKLNNVNKPELWIKMKKIIDLGGGFELNNDTLIEYRFPYTQLNKYFENLNIEPNNSAVCINKAKVFQNRDSNSKVKNILNFEIVKFDDSKSDSIYTKIETIDQKVKGFVKNTDIYKCTDYTLILIKKKNKRWVISSFAPYD